MSGLQEVRTRIESVQSTQQITNAMKMVAASKLRRAQDAILKLRPYANKLNEIIERIGETLETTESNPFAPKPEPSPRVLIVALSSNKGLCGAFNTSVIKEVIALTQTSLKINLENRQLDIICIGKKVYEALVRRNLPVIGEYNDIYSNLGYEKSEEISNMILEQYRDERYGKVVFVYNKFKNAAVQHVTVEDFLPIAGVSGEDNAPYGIEYLYEPEKEIILKTLIPNSLKIQFYKALLDSFASEHGARMTSMHKATDNAGEMLKELKLSYNKARQASITREIIEIVSGAEALKG